MKKLLLVTVPILALATLGLGYCFIDSQGGMQVSVSFGRPTLTPVPTAAAEKAVDGSASPETIGGDKDEGGCLPAAGYSWCEAKQKCLREWEEPCEQEEIFNLLQNLKKETSIDFSAIGKTSLEWRSGSKIILEGKGMAIEEASDTAAQRVKTFFQTNDFIVVSNTITEAASSLTSYKNSNIVCFFSEKLSSTSAETWNLGVKCAPAP